MPLVVARAAVKNIREMSNKLVEKSVHCEQEPPVLATSLLLRGADCDIVLKRAPYPTPNVDLREETGQGRWEERVKVIRTVGALK